MINFWSGKEKSQIIYIVTTKCLKLGSACYYEKHFLDSDWKQSTFFEFSGVCYLYYLFLMEPNKNLLKYILASTGTCQLLLCALVSALHFRVDHVKGWICCFAISFISKLFGHILYLRTFIHVYGFMTSESWNKQVASVMKVLTFKRDKK